MTSSDKLLSVPSVGVNKKSGVGGSLPGMENGAFCFPWVGTGCAAVWWSHSSREITIRLVGVDADAGMDFYEHTSPLNSILPDCRRLQSMKK